jgi:hypothetical protein
MRLGVDGSRQMPTDGSRSVAALAGGADDREHDA